MYSPQSNTARKWHGFSVRIEIDLVVVWLVEIYVISEWGIGVVTWFQWRDHNCLGFVGESKMTWFRVWIEIYLVFVSGGMQSWLLIEVGIEIDLTSVMGSKLYWFSVDDRNWLGFSMRTKIDVFCAGIKIDLVDVCGLKITCFQCEHGNWLGFCDSRVWLDLSVGDRTWLDFSVGMKSIWLCGW